MSHHLPHQVENARRSGQFGRGHSHVHGVGPNGKLSGHIFYRVSQILLGIVDLLGPQIILPSEYGELPVA